MIDLTIDDFSSRSLSPGDRSRWAEFVAKNAGHYCQLLEWRQVFAASYQLETHFLMISEGENPIGVLPLAVIPHPFARKSVSLPYCNYGGLLVSEGADRTQILKSALSYLGKHNIKRVEVRELCSQDDASDSSEVTLVLDLPDLPELLWKKIGDKARNQVRKAERAGLVVQWGRDQAHDLYDIYADNMGRLGTPVHSRAFIDEILAAFGERADVLTVRFDGRAIAAMLVLKHGGTWIDPIASSRTEFNRMNPNMLLYWEVLRQAISAGAKLFDFGRSKRESGTYRFKRQWGAQSIPLDYHTYVDGIRINSASTDTYRGGKAALFAKMWSKLPCAAQRFIGPKVRRYIP